MINTSDHLRKIRETKDLLKTATGVRQNDLKKYLNRLNKELAECKMYMSGGESKCQSPKT